jgi:hypothetical protein
MATDLSEGGVNAETLVLTPRHSLRKKVKSVVRLAVLGVLCQAASFTADVAHAQPRPQDALVQAGSVPQALPADMAVVPFGVGEHMEYDVKFSALKVGTGTMDVRDIVPIRDQPSWHTALSIKGRALGVFSVNMAFESWFDVVTLASRRFHEDQSYPGYKKNQTTEIFPERGMFREGDKD